MENRVPSLAKGQRILAAIMVTDAVSFSTHMSKDEELTLQLIDRDLNLIAQLCEDYQGVLLKTTGDGMLTYFVSAVQAVSCALSIQERLANLASGLAKHQYLEHRIGIHLGDILVSQSDVMGNGVNIAARLQTFAPAGGLCISQAIFDVVKARLTLNASFLGPLKLKNIQEPIPAFKITLDSSELAEEEVASTQLGELTPEALLESAIHGLNASIHRQRIKKLIFALCQQTWENDPAVLAKFDLGDLLTTLRRNYPTLFHLKQKLTRVVARLNRKGTYATVAEIIISQLEPWYANTSDPTEPLAVSGEPLSQNTLAGVLSALATLSEPQRIRKLFYCISYNTWENNNRVLTQFSLAELTIDVSRIAPTLQGLDYRLKQIVKRLNRQSEYTQLANAIVQAMGPLYAQESKASAISAPMGRELNSAQTTFAQIEQSHSQEQRVMRGSPTPLPAPQPSSKDLVFEDGYPSHCLARSRANLYDLRQEIMRYTNPLRAKILLYSCLHGPFGFSRQDWTALRAYTLEQLLRESFDYCSNFEDLSSKLTIITHCLDNAEENRQVADAIIQAMKPYYVSLGSANGTLPQNTSSTRVAQASRQTASLTSTGSLGESNANGRQ